MNLNLKPLAAGFAMLFLAACGSKSEKSAQAGAQPTEPQPYPVFQVQNQSTTLETDYPATLEGIQNVDIRPKVDGFIERIFVDEGAMGRNVQVLFSINARH